MYKLNRVRRHKSVRRNIAGNAEKPRLAVFRSSQHIYAQIIDDSKNQTLISESDLKIEKGSKMEKAKAVGENLAKKAVKKNIKQVVFDRGGFKYHGRVSALAEGARSGGLEF